jgi:hypothetical protein
MVVSIRMPYSGSKDPQSIPFRILDEKNVIGTVAFGEYFRFLLPVVVPPMNHVNLSQPLKCALPTQPDVITSLVNC